jgi:hypothetical protein
MAIIFSIYFFLFTTTLFAQFERGTIDTVFSVSFGTGTTFGQSGMYFPMNIYGLPDTNARIDVPAATQEQVLSLGLNGSITIGFKNYMIRDMQGNDFTIFENAFQYLDHRIFIEPAKVEVSKNGIDFYSFPFDSLTLNGCAGTFPTNGNENPFDPAVSGGNNFDLADIGMDSIIAIRIIDVSSIILQSEHPLYNPIVNGFDLDAVVGIHLQKIENISSVQYQLTNNSLVFSSGFRMLPKEGEIISLFSLNGILLSSSTEKTLEYSQKGTYLLITQRNNEVKRNVIHIY